MNKQPQITAATRQRIVDAFWALYENSPVGQIRIKEIASGAEINRCTFYQYFTDIYDILRQEEGRIISGIIERRTALDGASGPAEIMSGISEMYLSNGRYLCILTGENGDPGFGLMLRERLLTEFARREGLPAAPETAIVFGFGLSGLLAAFRTWYLGDPRLPAGEFLALAEDMIVRGIPAALSTLKSGSPARGSGAPLSGAESP
jgi:AcrR family transcriptional regulator